MRNESNRGLTAATGSSAHSMPNEEPATLEETGQPNWRTAFRAALDKARRQQKPVDSRQELSRDKSRSVFLLVGVGVALLLLFFGVFSRPKRRTPLSGENPRGQANLGRKVTPGQGATDASRAVTPLLSADVRSTDQALRGQVTAEDVDRTARTPIGTSAAKRTQPQQYALNTVDFGNGTAYPSPPQTSDPVQDLKKPSLVFVRAAESVPAVGPHQPTEEEEVLALPAGTRLVARLQAPVSSAVPTPVVAVVEYNYEYNGQILLPAGAKVFGRLTQVNPSGYVGMHFSEVEMPDGTAERVDASAMDLHFRPLKGYVSGKRTGTRFLVRSLTGLGTMASYLVGPQGSGSSGLISSNTLMREQLAENMANAGQEELNGLAFSENVVVTVPGNTRFYIVVQNPSGGHSGALGRRVVSTNSATSGIEQVPTLEELRQLLQLKREINELYSQTSAQTASQPSR